MALSSTERGRALKERRKKLGLKRAEIWIRPEHSETLKRVEKILQKEEDSILIFL